MISSISFLQSQKILPINKKQFEIVWGDCRNVIENSIPKGFFFPSSSTKNFVSEDDTELKLINISKAIFLTLRSF